MLLVLLHLTVSVTVEHLSATDILENKRPGWLFIMACPSESFDFPKMSRMFTRAAHLSRIENAKFAVVDTSIDNVKPNDLNVTHFPALIFMENGTSIYAQVRGLDEDSMIGFMNTNAVSAPLRLDTKEQLEQAYSESSAALLCAVEDASDETLPNIAKFYRTHFHEVTVFYTNPYVMDKPGFYLYRRLDGNLVELDNLKDKDDHEIAVIISENLAPEFAKLNSMQASFYENLGEPYVILMLVMDDFYLSSQQLELARELKKRTHVNVTYVDVENFQVAGFRYGLPDSLDSTMSVIEPKNGRIYKYILTEQLTLENAEKLVNSVKAGTATKYWRSETETISKTDGPQPVSANYLLDLVRTQKTFSLALYYGHLDQLEAYTNATKIVKETVKDALLGRFSLGFNDWPLEDFDNSNLPYLMVFVNGKKSFEGPMPATTDECAMTLTKAFENRMTQEL